MKKLSLLLFIILLTGCTRNLDKQSAINWWNNNSSIAIDIVSLIHTNPEIERVYLKRKVKHIPNHNNFTVDTWIVYRKVENILKQNSELDFIIFSKMSNEMIIEIVMDRYGYAIGEGGGCILSIVYYDNEDTYKSMKKHIVYSEKLKPNWYLEINGDKECIRHAQ